MIVPVYHSLQFQIIPRNDVVLVEKTWPKNDNKYMHALFKSVIEQVTSTDIILQQTNGRSLQDEPKNQWP